MAAVRIASNRYRLPVGYRNGSSALRSSINGYARYRKDPGNIILGASQVFTVASVPADLSTFVLNGADGKIYSFQFVYAGSIQTSGILIALPAAGASTAAQVATAVLGVISQTSGTPLAGTAQVYPWVTAQPASNKFEIDWTINGPAAVESGTQGTISVVNGAPDINGETQVVPSCFGPIHSLAPGF